MRSPARTALLACAAFSLALSLGASPAASAQKKVIFTAGADAQSLDPALQPSGTYDALLQVAPYDTLVFQTPEGKIEPALATSWKFKDDTTLVFTLRQGVRYHDGTPFKAEDVKFNF